MKFLRRRFQKIKRLCGAFLSDWRALYCMNFYFFISIFLCIIEADSHLSFRRRNKHDKFLHNKNLFSWIWSSLKRLLWQTWTSWGREKLCRMKNNLIMTRGNRGFAWKNFFNSHWTHRRQSDSRVARTLRLVLNIWAMKACVDGRFCCRKYQNNGIFFGNLFVNQIAKTFH